MKKNVLAIAIAAILFLVNNANAQEQHRMKFTAFHFDYTPASQLGYGTEKIVTPEIGASASINAGGEHINMVLEYDYRTAKLTQFTAPSITKLTSHEFYIGFRYFPMRPTFMTGNMAIRITGGALYGFDMEPNWKGLLFAGVALTPINSVNGFTINVLYHPGIKSVKGYTMYPSVGLRVGMILGPSMN